MKKSTLLRVLWAVVAGIALTWAPKPVFAQHGGHGGGGGFHGGGGYGYGGGHFYGGYHGGGYYGWRGGYYGWRGGYRGYPRYGYGWGFGIGFSWGSYWPAYPYPYAYSPWWVAPYYYPYYAPYYVPSGYPSPYNGSNDASPPDSGSNSYDNSPVKHSSTPALGSSPNTNSVTSNVPVSAPTIPSYRVGVTGGTASNYRLVHSTMQQLPPPRREVQNVILALRAMPPDARQRQIDSGRYSNFSPEERELLNNAAQLPLAWEKPPQSVPRPPL